MKQIKINFLFLVFVLGIIISCSSPREKAEVQAYEEIKYFMGDYFEIDGKSFEVTKSDEMFKDWIIMIKVKFKKEVDEDNIELQEGIEFSTLSLSLLNSKGMPINGLDKFKITSDSDEKLSGLFWRDIGDSEWLKFECEVPLGSEYEDELPESATHFILETIGKEESEEYSNDQTTIENNNNDRNEDNEYEEYDQETNIDETIEENHSNEFDEWLSAYEEYMTEYIDLIKRAKEGDMTVMTEYMDMAKKLQEAGRKLDNSRNDMTPEQVQRLLEMQAKVTKLAMELQ